MRTCSRGTGDNPANRFETLQPESDPEAPPEDPGATLYLKDHAASLITTNKSPDIPFEASINPYRGCEHGCVYCYARPTHEYLGYSCGLDFETRILVKEEAPDLLRRELSAPGWKPKVLAMSGVTDPYQPVERRLGITRSCLEVLADFLNPVGIVTKNELVLRDIDHLERLAEARAVRVHISLTTLDGTLRRRLEPRTSPPEARLRTIERLALAGIPVGVLVAPIIPGLNDHEIPGILERAAGAGATTAGRVLLRLPHGVKDLFVGWLREHYPQREAKVLGRLRSLRDGDMSSSAFHGRMTGAGIHAEQIRQLFELSCRRHGLDREGAPLSTRHFRRDPAQQLLF